MNTKRKISQCFFKTALVVSAVLLGASASEVSTEVRRQVWSSPVPLPPSVPVRRQVYGSPVPPAPAPYNQIQPATYAPYNTDSDYSTTAPTYFAYTVTIPSDSTTTRAHVAPACSTTFMERQSLSTIGLVHRTRAPQILHSPWTLIPRQLSRWFLKVPCTAVRIILNALRLGLQARFVQQRHSIGIALEGVGKALEVCTSLQIKSTLILVCVCGDS